MKNDKYHEPVLVHEVLEALGLIAPLKTQARIIDATVGTGGHCLEMVKRGVNALGIEADRAMVEIAEERLKACPTPNNMIGGFCKIVYGNFRDIDRIASENGFNQVDGIIFDLGVSNLQLLSDGRGFSFSNPSAPLDMRLDKNKQGVTAADLLNGLREDQLKELFKITLKPHQTNYIVKNILLKRESRPFEKVGDFVELCAKMRVKENLHPATLPFLALRIAVNSELENLEEALFKAPALLKKGGKLLVIVFHSQERGIVLNFAKSEKNKNVLNLVSDEPIESSQEEIERNPRSRSAKLYIFKKK